MAEKVILSVETSEKVASLCVSRGDSILSSVKLDESEQQSAELVPLLDKALTNAEINSEEIGIIAVHVGPGAATGLRMGLAMVQAILAVHPHIVVYQVYLENLACEALNQTQTEGIEAYLIANAFGGGVFVQKYLKSTNDWCLDGELLQSTPVEIVESLKDIVVIHDLGNLRQKIEWPLNWKWNDVKFVNAKNVLKAYLVGQSQEVNIDKLDVRYLKKTSAELNWKG